MYQEQRARATDGRPLPRVHTISAYMKVVCVVVMVLAPIGGLLGWLLGLPFMFVSLLALALEMAFVQLLGLAWLLNRIAQTAITRILTDARTIFWTYSEQEWQKFTIQSWQRSIRSCFIASGLLLGLALLFDLVLVSMQRSPGNLIIWEAAFAAAYGLLLFLINTVIFWTRRQRATSVVYLNREGVIMGGWYTSLGSLRSTRYKAGDPVTLRFLIGRGRSSRTIEVPVPRGREAEAEYLAQTLKRG